MKNYRTIFFIWILLNIYQQTCAKNKSSELATTNSITPLKTHTIEDSIYINFNSSVYFTYQSNYYNNENNYTLFYNTKDSALYLYAIDSSFRLLQKKSIAQLHDSTIQEIDDIYFHNFDTIALISNNTLYLFDTATHLFYKNEIKEKASADYIYGNIYKDYPAYIYGNYFYMMQFHNDGPQKFSYYQYPIQGKMNMASNTTSSDSIYQSKLLQNKNKLYGLLHNCVKVSHDTIGVLSFYCDPNLYVQNYKTGKIQAFGAKSPLQNVAIPTLHKKYIDNKIIQYEHFIASPFYTKIYWDPFRKVYYRFMLNGLDMQHHLPGKYPIFADKELVISVFDTSFQLLYSNTIGTYKKYGYGNLFITKACVYLLDNSKTTARTYLLRKLRFEK